MQDEAKARQAYEDEFQADSRDPSQAEKFALFLRGFTAGVASDRVGADGWRRLAESQQGLLRGGASRQWTEAEAITAAHAAGFSGESWVMGPEELALLLTLACSVTGARAQITCWGLSSFCAEVGHKCLAAGACVYAPPTPGVQAVHKSAPIQKRERPLPELPEAKVMVRDTDNEPEGGGWIVDCDCEGPLSYSLEAGEALYTFDQMREYARTALGVGGNDGS